MREKHKHAYSTVADCVEIESTCSTIHSLHPYLSTTSCFAIGAPLSPATTTKAMICYLVHAGPMC